jgi:hypothetical protein
MYRSGGLEHRSNAEVMVITPFAVMTAEMPTYVLLTTFTQQGVENVRDIHPDTNYST